MIVAASRTISFATKFSQFSLQKDFSAFYTAGQALLRGVSPYENRPYDADPLWDGAAFFRHSRFLYPPAAAMLFKPLARMTYHAAKSFWTYGILVATVAGTLLFWQASGARWNCTQLACTGIFMALFFPLLPLLERGQIDALTYVCMGLAVLLIPRGPVAGFWSGLIFAATAVVKLHIGILLPLLLLRRKWSACAGFVVGAVLIVLFSVLAVGTAGTREYIFKELPRISTYGEMGQRNWLLTRSDFRDVLRDVPPGLTTKGHDVYRPSMLDFEPNASLVRALRSMFPAASNSTAIWMAFVAIPLMVLLTLVSRIHVAAAIGDKVTEFAYWQAALMIVLLCGPVSWVMNVVWMLALVPLVFAIPLHASGRAQVARVGIIAALLIACVPDQIALLNVDLVKLALGPWRYPITELIAFGSLCLLIASSADAIGITQPEPISAPSLELNSSQIESA